MPAVQRKQIGVQFILESHGTRDQCFDRESVEAFCTELCALMNVAPRALHYEKDPSPKLSASGATTFSSCQFLAKGLVMIFGSRMWPVLYLELLLFNERLDVDIIRRCVVRWFGRTILVEHVLRER